MKKNATVVLTVFLALLLVLSGCGKSKVPDNSGEPDRVDTSVDTVEEVQESTEAAAEVAEGKKTLKMSICWDFYYVEEAAEKFKVLHPEFDISVTKYSNDYEKYTAQVSTALMAGTADDFLDGFGIDYKDSATVKLLADFYPIMEADPEFNEDDYFVNVFRALEYQGGLYTFPTSFSYNMVAVNNQVEDVLKKEFAQHEYISAFDLIDIYKTSGAGYYMHDSFDALTVLNDTYKSFIDEEKKTCDFNNPRFAGLINDAKAATEPDKMLGYTYGSNVYPPEEEATRSKKYLYQQFSADVFQYFLEFNEELKFGESRPYTDEKGNLQISPLKNFSISAKSENKELAWEFIKFMATEQDSGENGYVFIPSIPVNKGLFEFKYRSEVPGWINTFENEYGWSIKGDTQEQIEKLIAKMHELNNMPMSCSNFSAFYSVVSDTMESFNNGSLTAEQTASEIQNKVYLVLME